MTFPFAPLLCLRQSLLLLVCLLWASIGPKAQEPPLPNEEHEEAFRPSHALALILGHANVRRGRVQQNNRWLGLPSWGLDYTYVFHPRWSIGLHTDIVMEEFVVRRHFGGRESETLEREFPVAPALMVGWRLGRNSSWALEAGPGIELSSGESFFLTRFGLEYITDLPRHWELFGVLSYDIMWGGYDTIVLGIGIAKIFGRHEEHRH